MNGLSAGPLDQVGITGVGADRRRLRTAFLVALIVVQTARVRCSTEQIHSIGHRDARGIHQECVVNRLWLNFGGYPLGVAHTGLRCPQMRILICVATFTTPKASAGGDLGTSRRERAFPQ